MGGRHLAGTAIALATWVLLVTAGCDGGDVSRPDEVPPGGWWDVAGWRHFLDDWSHETLGILARTSAFYMTPMGREVLKRGTLAEPAASPGAIAALEARLGRPLPPSYKAFLQASAGWSQVGMDAEDGRLWPPERVRWFREQEPEWLAVWTKGFYPDPDDAHYFVYGEHQDPAQMRSRYLFSALAISAGIDSAIYLLNPRVTTPRGEWEAWFFGSKLPGAYRYRSFQALMMAERQRLSSALRHLADLS